MKQTEIGLIPDDWEVKRLGELFEMRAGGDVNKQHFSYYKSDFKNFTLLLFLLYYLSFFSIFVKTVAMLQEIFYFFFVIILIV